MAHNCKGNICNQWCADCGHPCRQHQLTKENQKRKCYDVFKGTNQMSGRPFDNAIDEPCPCKDFKEPK